MVPLINDPVEKAHFTSSYSIKPFNTNNYIKFDYFNYSVYYFDSKSDSIVRMSFNENFTHLTLTDVTHLEPNSTVAVAQSKITTNGKKLFIPKGLE